MNDHGWIAECLALAERGRGRVEPNPLVGAVVVRDGVAIGRGWHDRFGGPHAEVAALAEAGAAARGATLYVSLEPCCHHGKTPPCTDAILKAGIARVVAAMADPFPEVAGRGAALLTAAGVAVEVGLGETEARWLNRPYLTLLEKQRPYIHLKWAMTLDGKIASRSGDSQWISGEESRRLVHELRGRVDAIIVGANTVRVDNPLLTARPPGERIASRIVVSSRPQLPAGCKLLQTAADAPTIVASARPGTIPDVEVLVLPAESDRPSLPALFAELGRRRFTNVLVEGGAELFGSLLDAGLVDEVHAFLSPSLLGGRAAPGAIAGVGRERIVESLPLVRCDVTRTSDDVYVHGWV